MLNIYSVAPGVPGSRILSAPYHELIILADLVGLICILSLHNLRTKFKALVLSWIFNFISELLQNILVYLFSQLLQALDVKRLPRSPVSSNRVLRILGKGLMRMKSRL